ncbi:MAG TPA: PASTA domain-containing protein, partial [Terracidiphilus sp.]|nr:PASTA domain-containing protein [Terracidiphilus sp.]
TQSPAPGTIVRRDWRMRVSESLGPQKVDVPNVIGRDDRVAALELRRVGLEVGLIAHLPDAGLTEGTIIAQDPSPHAQGIEQPSVNLLVAAPGDEAPDGYVMPSFIGLPIVTAQTQLAGVGLRFAPPVFADADPPAAPVTPVAPGSVIAQQPPAGARVDQTTEIRLTVSK